MTWSDLIKNQDIFEPRHNGSFDKIIQKQISKLPLSIKYLKPI